jgi:hypothetical protein
MAAQPERRQCPFLARRLEDSVELRQLVETAERLGISKKRLEGWEPVTCHEYDEAGRLVSSRPEPEWDELQRSWMLALGEYRAGLCPCGCGHPMRDTISSEATGPAFHVPPPARCRARDALVQAQAVFKNPRPEAVLWHVRKGAAT